MGVVGVLLLLAVIGLFMLIFHVAVVLAGILLAIGVIGAFIAYLAGPYRARRY